MSQDANSTNTYKLPSSGDKKIDFRLVEFPGHPKLHNLLYDDLKRSNNVKGLVYLIDSSIDPKKLTEVAKFLYEILLVSERRQGGIDILIGCNKSDLFSSRQPNKIRDLLEVEIDNLRKLNSSNIGKVDGELNGVDEDSNDYLGQSINSKFTFDQLEGNFDVIGGSVLKKKIEKWECWIDERSVN
jgi:signal recognition particle receptor subunit beta